ncbi:hypothetical protein FC699_23460, partial [Bacillus wiedmannii]
MYNSNYPSYNTYDQYTSNHPSYNTYDQYNPNHSSYNTYDQYNEYRVDRDVRLQSLAQSGSHGGEYLDIDGNTGDVVLSSGGSGTNWRLTELQQGFINLQNLGISRFKNYFLGVNPNNGRVKLLNYISNETRWIPHNISQNQIRLENG